jgi:hypothetical protein
MSFGHILCKRQPTDRIEVRKAFKSP